METRNNQTVTFTGHRKEHILQGFGNDPRIFAQIREAAAGMVIELCRQGYKEYYTGMASGFDVTAAETVLQVRERYEGIRFIAAVPLRKQPLWSETEDRLLYARLQEGVDRMVMVSKNHHKGCYLRRDEYVVREADTAITYWDLVPKRGTSYTVSKASESGKPVIDLYKRMKQRLSILERKNEVQKPIGLHTSLPVYYIIYSSEPEERTRYFLRSSFFAFYCFFLTSISAIICFKGLAVSGSSRLNRLK